MVSLGLPILVGEYLLAHPAVRLMFGHQWLGSAPLLRWLAISLMPALFALPMAPLVMSFGRTHIFFKRNLFEVCVKLPLVIVGVIKYGFMGVVIARCISESMTVLFCMAVVRRLIGLPIRQQLLGPWRSIVAVTAMALVVGLTSPTLTAADAVAPLAAGLLLVAALGAATYCVVLGCLWAASGSPAGLEAMVAAELTDLMRRGRRLAALGLS
jgi:O-antigen/teichoic acid export membrane protein